MKKAILLIHFGTTHADAREKTISALRTKIEEKFPNYDVFEAFTSRMILKKLRERGEKVQNPLELIEDLKQQGYTHIHAQTTHILHGIEYQNLVHEIKGQAKFFEKVTMGHPLLSKVEDYQRVAKTLGEKERNSEEAVIYVGHGTEHHANASYGMMRYVFQQENYDRFFVGTVEGYPSLEEVLHEIEKIYGEQKPKLILKPFMFVAGEHAKNDIAIDWKEALEEKGYLVSRVVLEGLGESKEIQDIFMRHLEESMSEEKISIAEYKKRIG